MSRRLSGPSSTEAIFAPRRGVMQPACKVVDLPPGVSRLVTNRNAQPAPVNVCCHVTPAPPTLRQEFHGASSSTTSLGSIIALCNTNIEPRPRLLPSAALAMGPRQRPLPPTAAPLDQPTTRLSYGTPASPFLHQHHRTPTPTHLTFPTPAPAVADRP